MAGVVKLHSKAEDAGAIFGAWWVKAEVSISMLLRGKTFVLRQFEGAHLYHALPLEPSLLKKWQQDLLIMTALGYQSRFCFLPAVI